MTKSPEYYRSIVHEAAKGVLTAVKPIRLEDRAMWYELLEDVCDLVKVSLMAEETIIENNQPKHDN